MLNGLVDQNLAISVQKTASGDGGDKHQLCHQHLILGLEIFFGFKVVKHPV